MHPFIKATEQRTSVRHTFAPGQLVRDASGDLMELAYWEQTTYDDGTVFAEAKGWPVFSKSLKRKGTARYCAHLGPWQNIEVEQVVER